MYIVGDVKLFGGMYSSGVCICLDYFSSCLVSSQLHTSSCIVVDHTMPASCFFTPHSLDFVMSHFPSWNLIWLVIWPIHVIFNNGRPCNPGVTVSGIDPSVITFSSFMTSCGDGFQWQMAVHCFRGLETRQLSECRRNHGQMTIS